MNVVNKATATKELKDGRRRGSPKPLSNEIIGVTTPVMKLSKQTIEKISLLGGLVVAIVTFGLLQRYDTNTEPATVQATAVRTPDTSDPTALLPREKVDTAAATKALKNCITANAKYYTLENEVDLSTDRCKVEFTDHMDGCESIGRDEDNCSMEVVLFTDSVLKVSGKPVEPPTTEPPTAQPTQNVLSWQPESFSIQQEIAPIQGTASEQPNVPSKDQSSGSPPSYSRFAAKLQSVIVSRGFQPMGKTWLGDADTNGNKLLVQPVVCKNVSDGHCQKPFIAFNDHFLGTDTYLPSWGVHDVAQERVGSFSAVYEDFSDPIQMPPPTKVTYTWDGHKLSAIGMPPTRTSAP